MAEICEVPEEVYVYINIYLCSSSFLYSLPFAAALHAHLVQHENPNMFDFETGIIIGIR